MNVDITRVRMYNQIDNPFPPLTVHSLNVEIAQKHIRVIALGKNAMTYLMKVGVTEFYSLPHPSGANLAANKSKELTKRLNQCREYIYAA